MARKIKQLKFFHNSEECDGEIIVSLIFLVEGFEIWFDGLCSRCGSKVRCVNQLEQLIFMCPNPQNRPFWKPPIPPLKKELNKDDVDFLKELGISPDEGGGDDEKKKKN